MHIILHNLFGRQAVLFVQRQKEEREHDQHHTQRGGTVPGAAPEQKEKRDADECAAAKTQELPLGQIEQHLIFYLA